MSAVGIIGLQAGEDVNRKPYRTYSQPAGPGIRRRSLERCTHVE